ncbi:MAG: ChbG/HpnK family deacetylase [Agriterribacter sp.]
MKENPWVLTDIEKEWRAQIELALKHIPRISHISAHMGCTDLTEETKALTKKLAKEYHIDIDLAEKGVKGIGYIGSSKTTAEKKVSFAAMLNSLQQGETYLFVDHPALNNIETKAIHHIGYANVAEDRQGVTDTWTDPIIIALIKKKKIQLITYKDLAKLP